MRSRVRAAALAFAATLVASCAGASAAPDGGIAVILKEWEIAPKEISAAAGAVTFVVKNGGTLEHNFVIDGVTTLDAIPAREMKRLTVTLPAGTYTTVCTLAGHKEAGMTGRLVVR